MAAIRVQLVKHILHLLDGWRRSPDRRTFAGGVTSGGGGQVRVVDQELVLLAGHDAVIGGAGRLGGLCPVHDRSSLRHSASGSYVAWCHERFTRARARWSTVSAKVSNPAVSTPAA